MPIDLNDTGLETQFSFGDVSGNVVDDPPFHILALGNWSGDADKRDLSSRRPIEIDRDNLDEVISRLNTCVELDFDDGSVLNLEFGSLDDFHPDEIFRRVEMFDQLRSLRKRLNSSDTFRDAAYDARQLFGLKGEDVEPTAPQPDNEPAADDLLDAILAKPEGGAAAPKRKLSGELGSLVSDLVRPHLVTVDEEQQSSLVALADAATSGLMRKILHHRKFQALEAAWRGLFFLVRRTDTSSDLKIFILDAAKDEIASDLKDAEGLSAASLYSILVRDAVETQGADPWSLVIGDYAFAPVVDDVAALMRISKICAASGAPFVSHMRPDVLGVHSLYEHPDPAEWSAASSDAAKLWAALGGQPESAFLGMTIPRFITRLPYGSDTEPLDTFSFEEFEAASEHDNYLWSNGCFAAAQLLGDSFANYGWEMKDRLSQDIERLPLHVYKQDGETIYKPCAEIPMTDAAVNKLIAADFMPLISFRDTDRVKLAMFQSVSGSALRGRWH